MPDLTKVSEAATNLELMLDTLIKYVCVFDFCVSLRVWLCECE